MTAVMVADLYDQGRYGEAITLAQETQANELGGGAPVTDLDSLTAYVENPRVQRAIAFFAGAVSNQGSYDAFQLHYYGPWRGEIEMYDYVRAHGITLPIETWEVAHRYRDGRPFVEQEHADEAARLLIAAAGEGSAFSIFTSYLGNAENDDIGLFAFDGTTPHDARLSFRTVVAELAGATSAQRLEVGGDAWGYRFERPQGSVSVGWSDPRVSRLGNDLGIDATTALVTPAGGTPSHRRLRKLDFGPTPLFAEPDLVELDVGGKSRRQVKLRLSCPAASPRRSCAGRIKVLSAPSKQTKRKQSKRPRPLGKARFRVARGEHERVRVRFKRHGKPGQAVAKTKRCRVRGRGGCMSWVDVG